ncbi:three component ABC system middle component [Saccharococcus caldoxylosilyticus]|uniref:three component ABC system middle component n=1 Tax=Saccharococcus caldoxylosilyticus TaxID=81408 RepID=UPI001FCBFB9C|nr:three component ABC system middle component [Parageobacillus caldoxylosilyticus]BDG36365.1 hypothetical protein PcaKH15_22710 [Parageobacillus caldoxylosilyticus]BDG40152.1 hypothetical protein PcaKH16_22910 [Parageobacillus caldoxylosilyticus]BDG43878.1 hypothetical protein PcaKH35_22230 [Parageobacillus caldoxylosilyticus]
MIFEEKPIEVEILLNPAFCGEVFRRCISEYQKYTNSAFPVSIIYLVLALVLHKFTRESILKNRRKQMHVWLQENQEVLINLPNRIKSLVSISNETLIFLLHTNSICINEEGNINLNKYRKKTKGFKNSEISDCFSAAEIIGRWFARVGDETTIYAMLGVKP